MKHYCCITLVIATMGMGCDKLTSKTQGVAIVTRTPDIAQSNGMDATLATTLSAQLDALPSVATAVAVGVAERDSLTSTELRPVGGAKVQVSFQSATVNLCEIQNDQSGTYSAISIPGESCGDADLAYVENAKYTITIETAEDEHIIRVTAPPAILPSAIVFSPALSSALPVPAPQLQQHAINTALHVDWSAGAANRNAIVTVLRINFSGSYPSQAFNSGSWSADASNPIFDTAPRSPGDMIDWVLNEPATDTDIPATVFNQAGLYAVVVTPVELSTDVDNLSLGSGGMAGLGTPIVFFVQ